jgi:uncharacterized protein YodC (DUF2158 family)
MAKAKLQVGSTVKLRTGGGPTMVVEKIDGEHAQCIWFDANHQIHREKFLIVLLFDPFAPNTFA